jgi:GNAT superfamily N-acetyltransferase
MRLAPLTPESAGFDLLQAESQQEGHRMLLRFAENWQSGTNRFDRPGEMMLGAWHGDQLIGAAGRNVDPYDGNPRAGRVRHLYVAVDERRNGVGRQLILAIVSGAAEWFDYLNTNAPETAFAFYENHGFMRHEVEHVTHRLVLR